MNAEAATAKSASSKRAPAEKSAVQKAVDKAKAALEDRVALVNDTARAQERVVKAEAKLAEEQRSYQSAYEASLAAWTKSDLDGFGFRPPRRTSAASKAKPAGEAKPQKKAAKKAAASDSDGAGTPAA